MKLNLENIHDIEFDDINDAPDYANVYISSASYCENGKWRGLTEVELDWLGENESEWVYEKLIDYLY